MNIKIFYFVAIALIIGALPLPYGYYQLLRFIGCTSFAITAYLAYEHKNNAWPYALGFFAIIFNPFIKIVFEKEIWMVIDVIAGITLLVWTAIGMKNKILE